MRPRRITAYMVCTPAVQSRRYSYFDVETKSYLILPNLADSCVASLVPRTPTKLRADYEAAAALCLKMGMRSCKELREAKMVRPGRLSANDLATLVGTLISVLPALEELTLWTGWSAGPADGVQRLVEKLGAGSLPAVTFLDLNTMHVGNTGASALAAALGRGALPRLMILWLSEATIGDAGLVAPRAGLAAAARAGATQPLLQPARRRGPRRPRGATAAAGRCAAAAGWRADEAQTSSSTSTSPRSPTPAAPPSPRRARRRRSASARGPQSVWHPCFRRRIESCRRRGTGAHNL